MNLKYELQSIISGAGKNPTASLIEAAAHHLGKSKEASGSPQEIELTKNHEAARLIDWIKERQLLYEGIDENRFWPVVQSNVFIWSKTEDMSVN